MQKDVSIPNLLEALAAKWPSSFVARTDVGKFSGGLISPKYIANLDSRGVGPSGRFQSGRKICYPVQTLLFWLLERSKPVESNLAQFRQ